MSDESSVAKSSYQAKIRSEFKNASTETIINKRDFQKIFGKKKNFFNLSEDRVSLICQINLYSNKMSAIWGYGVAS